MTSVLALKTIKSNDCCFSGGLKWNVFNRLPSLHTCCTDPAADQGAWRRSRSPGMTEPPFLRHPFVVPTPSSLPMDDPATSRGQLCRRSPPPPPAPQALGPEPQRKSAAVSSREPCPARGLSPAWHHLSPGSDAGAALPRWVPTDLLHPPDHMGQTWDRRQIHHAGVWTQQSRLGVHPL